MKQYLEDIREFDLLDPEEEKKLAERIQDGEHEAVNVLVERNLPFVVYHVKKHYRRMVSLRISSKKETQD